MTTTPAARREQPSVRWQHVATCGAARAGELHTPHGMVPTPCFMAVATLGGLKGVTVQQAEAAGQGVLLGNTYHLALRPGAETVHALGGLHTFTGWRGPMLTDSGGFQVFSLSKQVELREAGVRFRNHLDGALFDLSPEESIRIQRLLGADIIMALDHFCAADAKRDQARDAAERSLRWLGRSVQAWRDHSAGLPGGAATQALYPIIQGGLDPTLRRDSALGCLAFDLPGTAIGGLAVGESASQRNAVLDLVCPLLPAHKPRYLMGVGTPLDLVQAVARGVDQFDCVLPTRMGRHGIAYTDAGPLRLKRATFARDAGPIDADTPSEASRVPRGAISHLLRAGEVLGGQLVSLHNLAYYQRLMRRCREAIIAGSFAQFSESFAAGYGDDVAGAGEDAAGD